MSNKHPMAEKQYWVAYCRKSTDAEDKQIHSLGDQEKANREDYDSLPEEEKAGRDLLVLTESRSAFKPNNRPEFQKILEMAKRGEVYGVIVVQVNRISRNPEDTGLFSQRLVGSEIKYLRTSLDRRVYTGADTSSIMLLTMEGTQGWKDSKDKGVRIKVGMKRGAERGNLMGVKPLGYDRTIRPDGSRMTIVDEARAPVVQRLFELAATGTMSLNDLTKQAKTLGLKSRKNKPVSQSTVHHILRNPAYKGWVRFDTELNENGQHPALITEEQWNRVQFILQSRNNNVARPQNFSLRELFIFGSKLKCGNCGRSLSPYRVKKKNNRVYYECKNPETKCKCCISQEALMTLMEEKFMTIQVGKGELEHIRGHLLRIHLEKSKNETIERKRINAEYEKAKEAITDWLKEHKNAQESGVEEEWKQEMQNRKEYRDGLQAQLNTLHNESNAWIDKLVGCFELLKVAQEALVYGSPQLREGILIALASNHRLVDGKLVWDLRSPYLESSQKEEHPEWWTISDSNRGPFECESNALTS
jgi:site-specific DNA recombinase